MNSEAIERAINLDTVLRGFEPYTVVISFYSLEKDEVGKDIPGMLPYEFAAVDATMAMLVLMACMDNKRFRFERIGTRYQIRTPDGRLQSLNDCYRETFHEAPHQTKRGFKYPKLKGANRHG